MANDYSNMVAYEGRTTRAYDSCDTWTPAGDAIDALERRLGGGANGYPRHVESRSARANYPIRPATQAPIRVYATAEAPWSTNDLRRGALQQR
jgi:hypothetical protein